ncbi:MAG: DegT/DnrJ/EryC1/StrS family aminotransferase [Bacteroidia bacterium]|nr:DegT/DnrJ/EryC1/StrS family aminotransferase [Bacteroidia bacterium]
MNIIPCLDLKRQHAQIKNEIFSEFEKVYTNTAFSGGTFVEEFEHLFASYLGAKHVICVNNGTSALQLAVMTLGIGPGDEVIVPANTFIATAWGVTHAGATPVFVDCLPDTWQIDPRDVKRKITSRTKAVIGVHLYGQPFEIDEVIEICNKHNLYLIEDAAQAHGAEYKGKKVGTFGNLACFSFYPGKNLGACGEGGAVVTNDEKFAKKIQQLRNHGSLTRYYHDIIGFNMRMGGLEAASLKIKLKYLDSWNEKRRKIAQRYFDEIKNLLIKMQKQPAQLKSVFHLFVVMCEKKEKFIEHLTQNNIQPAFHYPVPCHLQKAYSHLGYKSGSCPNAEKLSAECISLPMYPELEESEINHVISVINQFR